jgi:hypothetical protein
VWHRPRPVTLAWPRSGTGEVSVDERRHGRRPRGGADRWRRAGRSVRLERRVSLPRSRRRRSGPPSHSGSPPFLRLAVARTLPGGALAELALARGERSRRVRQLGAVCRVVARALHLSGVLGLSATAAGLCFTLTPLGTAVAGRFVAVSPTDSAPDGRWSRGCPRGDRSRPGEPLVCRDPLWVVVLALGVVGLGLGCSRSRISPR